MNEILYSILIGSCITFSGLILTLNLNKEQEKLVSKQKKF